MKKYIPIIFLIVFIAFAIVVGATKTKSTKKESNDTLRIVTSFYPLYYFASEIAGDKAEIKNITPAGAEPHDYDPTTQDIANITKSRLLILNGSVEGWGNKIKDTLKDTRVKVVVAGEGLLTQRIDEDGTNQVDPHIWLSPVRAKSEAHAIAQNIIKIDPTNSTYYVQNEKLLDDKLDALDSAYKQELSQCKHKNIITSHAAFGYLATEYHLEQVPISGLSPDAEPSAQQLATIATFARSQNIQYIFFENLVSPKLSQTIATEIGAQTLVLDPIEGVSEDDIKAGKNYYTIMQENLKNLKTALQCNP